MQPAGWPQPGLRGVEALWLTPLLKQGRLLAQIRQWGERSLFAIGTADPHYGAARLEAAVAATGGQQVVIEGADHSLEIVGSVMQTVEAMVEVVRALEPFLA